MKGCIGEAHYWNQFLPVAGDTCMCGKKYLVLLRKDDGYDPEKGLHIYHLELTEWEVYAATPSV